MDIIHFIYLICIELNQLPQSKFYNRWHPPKFCIYVSNRKILPNIYSFISHTKFTMTENSASDFFRSNKHDTDYWPLGSKVVVNLSWRSKGPFPVAPLAGNKTSKDLGCWRNKVVFTKKPQSAACCWSDAGQLFVL